MLKWNRAEELSETEQAEHPDIHPVVVQLLFNRGIRDAHEIDRFLNPQYEDAHDPFLFADMQKFVDRIRAALAKKERLCVYGDYDADGVCAASVMRETLNMLGIADVEVYIPHREQEGYGLNTAAIDYLKEKGISLIIAVDCATSNNNEIAYASEKGIEVMVLDHHVPPKELPKECRVLLNPSIEREPYPFKKLAAVGVVFKAAQALWKSFSLPAEQEKWLLDLVAIATITDMMPLIGENRILATYGLIVLNKTRRIGLRALFEEMKQASGEIGVYDIGFKIGPRLNAAGRLDHASISYKLLASSDPLEARELARTLNQKNSIRQSETDRILKEADAQVQRQLKKHKVLMAAGEGWPIGLVGLVSGRISEKYARPSLVASITKEGIAGSGRSIPRFNITSALHNASDYLERFGGHAGACGFSLKQGASLEAFHERVDALARQELSEDDIIKQLVIDAALSLDQLDWELIDELKRLEPHGMGNPRPVFACFGARVVSVRAVGSDGKHLRLRLAQNTVERSAIAFGFGAMIDTLGQGSIIDVAFSAEINEWNGSREIQLNVKDIAQ